MGTTETEAEGRETRAPASRPPVAHFTIAERAARGKAARAEVPRKSHGEWEPPPDRADPVELLEEQAATRVPELVPIRYGRMLVSPFTFFRGAAYLMAADLAGMPRTGLHAQLCGDAHLSNFGVFAAPDRRLVFDMNDFDETLPGPVRVGPQAARRELRGRRPRPRLRRRAPAAINLAVDAGLPRGDGRVRRDAHDGRLVLAGRRRGALAPLPAAGEREGAARASRRTSRRRGRRTAWRRSTS